MNDEERNGFDPFDEDDFLEDDDASDADDDTDGDTDGDTDDDTDDDAADDAAVDAADGDAANEGGDADTDTDAEDGDAPDSFASKADGDVAEIQKAFPALGITTLIGLHDLARYGELREKGMTAVEAFCATNAHLLTAGAERAGANKARGKAHLQGVARRTGARAASQMTTAERRIAQDFFDGMSDKDMERLFARATK